MFSASSCDRRFVIDEMRSESFDELALGAGLGGCYPIAAPTLGTLGDLCCCDPLISLEFSRGLRTKGIPPVGTRSGLLGCRALAPRSRLNSMAIFLATPVSSSSDALSRSKLSATFHFPCLN